LDAGGGNFSELSASVGEFDRLRHSGNPRHGYLPSRSRQHLVGLPACYELVNSKKPRRPCAPPALVVSVMALQPHMSQLGLGVVTDPKFPSNLTRVLRGERLLNHAVLQGAERRLGRDSWAKTSPSRRWPEVDKNWEKLKVTDRWTRWDVRTPVRVWAGQSWGRPNPTAPVINLRGVAWDQPGCFRLDPGFGCGSWFTTSTIRVIRCARGFQSDWNLPPGGTPATDPSVAGDQSPDDRDMLLPRHQHVY